MGDSWGCGAWGFLEKGSAGRRYGLIHAGLERFFVENGHTVKNISVAAGSNTVAIDRLFPVHDLDQWDYVFWFQTDALRSGSNITNFDYSRTDKWFDDYSDLIRLRNNLLDADYAYLNSYKKKIHCIGGCEKLNLDLIKKYDNLIPCVDSMIELLFDNKITHPEIWLTGRWSNKLDSRWSIETLDKILESQRKIDSLAKTDLGSYFHQDGAHPDEHGYKKLHDHIVADLQLKNFKSLVA